MTVTHQEINQDGDNEEKLSVDEIRSFLEENEEKHSEEESLVDPGDKLPSDRDERQGLNANNNTFRIVSVLLLTTISGFAVVFAASLYSGIGKGTKVVETQDESNTEIAEDSVSTDDKRKAELAWAHQDADLAPEPQPKIVKESEQEVAISKPQPRRVTTPPASQPSPEKEIDPLEEWARLASIGVAVGNNETEQQESPIASSVNTRLSTQPSRATNRPSIQDTVPTKTAIKPSPATEPNQLIASANIASVSIGKPKSEPRPTPEPLDINSQEVQNFLSDRNTPSQRLATLASAGVASSNFPSGDKSTLKGTLSDNGMASQRVADASNQMETSSKKIPFGTTAKGELSSTIIWSEGISSGTSRGKIVLEEPLLSDDGSVALDAGSTLIVQVGSIQNSGLSELEAIAVSYTDSSGILKQEPIPAQAIYIRGKNDSPLIADRSNDNGGSNLGQDVLMGALGAGERGFEVLNERDVDFVSNNFPNLNFDDDELDEEFGYDYSSFRSRRGQNASLITGAAEGVFETTKERLQQRSEQMANERASETPIYQLKEGMKVSIFVNSFLEINK